MKDFFKGDTDKEKLGNILIAIEKAEGVNIPFPVAQRLSEIYQKLVILVGEMP